MAGNIHLSRFRKTGYGCGTASAGRRNLNTCVSDCRGIEYTISIGDGRGVNYRWCFGGGGSAEGGGGANSVRGVDDDWILISGGSGEVGR